MNKKSIKRSHYVIYIIFLWLIIKFVNNWALAVLFQNIEFYSKKGLLRFLVINFDHAIHCFIMYITNRWCIVYGSLSKIYSLEVSRGITSNSKDLNYCYMCICVTWIEVYVFSLNWSRLKCKLCLTENTTVMTNYFKAFMVCTLSISNTNILGT